MRVTAQGSDLPPARLLGASDCEAVSSGVLAQPAAALSSLAFVLAAGALVALWRQRGATPRAVGWAYAAALALVGVGSLDYHGPQTPAAGLLHDLPVAVVVALAVGVPVGRRVRGQAAFARAGRRALVASGLLGALAVAAFALGRTGSPLCDPATLLQPHAAWHVLAASALAAWALLLVPNDHVLYSSGSCTMCVHLSKHPDASSSTATASGGSGTASGGSGTASGGSGTAGSGTWPADADEPVRV